MRIIPVLDLKGGIVVHARRGQRADYAPLSSPLVDGCDPVTVARALGALCRTRSLYVADLDALAGEPINETALAALSVVAEPWVDAGAATRERAAVLARAGVARNVVGTESIAPGTHLERTHLERTHLERTHLERTHLERTHLGRTHLERTHLGRTHLERTHLERTHLERTHLEPSAGPPLVLSVDLRDGRLISPDPKLAGRDPSAAVPLARALGVHELLVIDLARVGSGAGPPLDAVAELAAALPGVAVHAGGGVRDDDDLRALESAGAAGALVATALHEGRLTS